LGVAVRAVVFDLFNTLTVPVGYGVFRVSVHQMGLAAGVDPAGFTRGWFELLRESFDGTFGTPEAGVRGVCEAMGAAVDEAAVQRAVKVRADFSRQSLQPCADAVDTLSRVRSMGLKTALICDCLADIPDLWPTTAFAEYIDKPLFSCVEGLIKPDSSIYLRACERLGVEPQDCVYVGDGAHQELTGAQRVGMRAVLIRTPEDRAAADDSESGSWRGEAIEALSELPELIADKCSP
jgi:putative hydrolase of the HAD superfamily